MIKEINILNKSIIKGYIEEINYNIKNKKETILDFFSGSIGMHISINKECELVCKYDCDSEDLVDIEFNHLKNLYIDGFSLDDTRKIFIDINSDNELEHISFYQKDNTVIAMEFLDEKIFNIG